MKRAVLLLLTILVACVAAMAQPQHGGDHKEKRERIKALQVAYYTDKLDLKADQAEKFWPVYNTFEKERHQLRKKFIDKYKNDNPTGNPREAHEFIDANIDYQEQELALKKRYKGELLKTISAQQLAELYKAEVSFKQMLIKELGKRGGAAPPGKQPGK